MGVGYNPKIVTDGLVLYLDAANPKSYNYNLVTYSQDFQNAVYSKSTGLISATGVLAPDSTLTATTMTDDDAANWESFVRNFTVPNDSSIYNVSLYIRKTTGGTSPTTGFNISFAGGTQKNYFPRFNTDTGSLGGGDTNVVTSENNNYWRISFTISNNGTGNTTLNISYYPATGPYGGSDLNTTTGNQTVWGFQITRGATLLPYLVNTTYSDLILYDLSGNVNNGALTNGPTYIRSNNGYMNFDGVDDNITTSYVPVNTGGSISVWFRLNAHKDFNTIFDNALGANDWEFWVYGTGVARFRSTADNSDYILDSDALLINTWYNFVITWTSTEAKMYKNGLLFAQDTTTGTKVVPSTLNFGGGNAGNTKLNGYIANASAYNRSLSAVEVLQNFNATRGRFGI